jgi:hypothetical protein
VMTVDTVLPLGQECGVSEYRRCCAGEDRSEG